MNRVVFLSRLIDLGAQLDTALEFGIGGLKKLVKTVPPHLDKRGITAVTGASAYTPSAKPLPGKGMTLSNGLRAVREKWAPGMLKSRRRLQLIDDATGTQVTVMRPRKKVWNIETLSNASRPSDIPNENLAKAYSRYGFKPNRQMITRKSKHYGVTTPPTNAQVIEKVGGLPMIRRPKPGAKP